MAAAGCRGGAGENPGFRSTAGESEDARFDASQYAFFGAGVTEDVELGGLGDDDGDFGFIELGDENYQLLHDKDALELKNVSSGAMHSHIISHGSSLSEASSTISWTQEPRPSQWHDQHVLDAVNDHRGQRWLPRTDHANLLGDSMLYRTLSSPQQEYGGNLNDLVLRTLASPLSRTASLTEQEHLHNFSEPGPISSSAYPVHSQFGFPHALHSQNSRHIRRAPSNAPAQFSSPGVSHGLLPSGENMSLAGALGFQLNSRQQQQQLMNRRTFSTGDTGFVANHQLLRQQSDLIQRQILSLRQQEMHQFLRPPPQYLHIQPQRSANQHPSLQMLNNTMSVLPDLSGLRNRPPVYHGRPGPQLSAQRSDFGSMRLGYGWSQFRPKYMSIQEIESIARLQLAATHGSDPYVEDYYHQACLAKRLAGSGMKHHFCPNLYKDPSSREHGKDDPVAYLKVEALGRLHFANIRRPRPLLDVEQTSTTCVNGPEHKTYVKPLEQEPMLAARIMIEDGLCLLLDVDDIDRFIQCTQQQGGGLQLRNRRETLLDQIASTLHIVDPLGPGRAGHYTAQDDALFLRIISLPKGRKLMSLYLNAVMPGSELARVLCMAIFRHLRYIFGNLPSDTSVAKALQNLVKSVSDCTSSMNLRSLGACLAAAVCSVEQPPLRPYRHASGDGASVVLKGILDKATEVLTSHDLSSNCTMQDRALWQASFDDFFQLLTGYCMSKFDSLICSVDIRAPDASMVINGEMPVELLRASLPHTNEQQRKVLLDFARRTVPTGGI